MNRWKCWAVALLAAGAATAGQAADVGVSIQISEPGLYGRIDLGRFPQPQVVVTRPIVVQAPPPGVIVVQPSQPVYLWVPPGHRKNWRKHCSRYQACATPVVFVRDDWYQAQVMPYAKPKKGKQGKGKHDD